MGTDCGCLKISGDDQGGDEDDDDEDDEGDDDEGDEDVSTTSIFLSSHAFIYVYIRMCSILVWFSSWTGEPTCEMHSLGSCSPGCWFLGWGITTMDIVIGIDSSGFSCKNQHTYVMLFLVLML